MPRIVLPLILTLACSAALADDSTGKIKPLNDTTVAVTDLTDAGRELPTPSPQHPVYFVGINAGFRVYAANVIAGDPPPEPKTMLRIITQVLAGQGFLAADAAHPATQIIVCSWGVISSGGHNFLGPGSGLQFLGGDKLNFVNETSITGTGPTLNDAMCRNFRSGAADTILAMSHDTLYAVLLRAYDLQAAKIGKSTQLWETRIACSAPGNSLAEALPRIVVSGQHMIGRETTKPVVENAAHTRQAWVEIGETTVVDYIDLADFAKAKEAANEQPLEQNRAPTPTTPAPVQNTK
jgi:hypothetical protein